MTVPLQRGKVFFEDVHALLQGFRKTFLLKLQDAFNVCLVFCQFRIGVTHLRNQRRNHLVEEQLLHAQLVAVAYGTPDDATQYVAAAFIGWQHAIDYKKAAGTNMVREDPQ